MTKRAKHLLFACVVPVLVLLAMCVPPVYTLAKGQAVILATIPLDPSDPFRGDYVSLRYAAEEVPKRLVGEDVLEKYQKAWGQLTVYVLLEEKDGVHTPKKVTLEKPEEGVFLKGTLSYIDESIEGKGIAHIDYDFDHYFVEDNTGTEWEKASMQGDILAKLRVHNGYAVLVDIMKK